MTELRNKYNEKVVKLNNTFFLHQKYKSLIVIFALSLVLIHFFSMAVFPGSLMANKVILIIVLGLMLYIWIQELKDKRRLQLLNKNLINAQNRLERAEIDMILTLILTAEAKDLYTHGHSKRVAGYSLSIAKAMRLPAEEQRLIERAAILHDLGKIGIDDNILRKEGKLTEEEWKIMKDHPRRAVDILEPLKFLFKEKDIVLHHHEMYNGRGYPDGLKGDSIPLGSQIIAVADTFDAMNTARSYRDALPKEAIVEELKKSSGTQLSQKITDVFLKLLEKKSELWKLVHEKVM